VLLLVVALGLLFLWIGHAAAREPPAVVDPAVDPLVDPVGVRAGVDAAPLVVPDHQRTIAPATVPDRFEDDRSLVRVHGRVLRQGLPVSGCDLSFHAAAEAWREIAVDWSLTDRQGRYEVELPADRYCISFQDAGVWPGTVVVTSGVAELTFDFELQ
jgi:hypothetical protein